MNGSRLTSGKTPEDEWENQWLRAWRKPPEPELYPGVHEFAAELVRADYEIPVVADKRVRPGEVRIVRDARHDVCVHEVDLAVSCEQCLAAPARREMRRWWHRRFLRSL